MGPGIGKQFWRLVCGKKYGASGNLLFMKPAVRREIGSAVALSASSIPSAFTSCIIDMSHQAGSLKSIDWIDFMRYVVPTLLLEHVSDKHAKKAVFALSQVYDITFQPVITDHDIRELVKHVWIWLTFLKNNVRQGKIKGSVFTISQHYLQHLDEIIRAMGPPKYYAAFAMERAIGEIKHKINSPSAPGSNAGNVMVQLAAQRYADRIEAPKGQLPVKKRTVLSASTKLNEAEIWGPLWTADVQDFKKYGFEQLLKVFWCIHIKNMEQVHPVIEAGARLWISEREIIGSSFRQRDPSRRDDFYVRMVIDVDISKTRKIKRKPKVYFGEVVFYFRHTQQRHTKLLALVKTWDVSLDTNGQPYLRRNCDSRLCIVSAGDIRSIAGIYTATSERRYIVWPEKKLLKEKDLGAITRLDY